MRLFFLLILISSSLAKAQNAGESECVTKTKMRRVPGLIKKAIEERYDTKLSMANPGREFQKTDVVTGWWPKRERRLIAYVECDSDLYLLYEYGGYGSGRKIVHLTKGERSVSVLETYDIGDRKGDTWELIALLTSGKLKKAIGGF